MNVTLHIDGQSTEVDVPPDIIIDVVDADDDITNDEDAFRHDFAESDNEDLINVDVDGVDKMSADVAWSHSGDGGGKDRPLHTMYQAVVWVALLTEMIMGLRFVLGVCFNCALCRPQPLRSTRRSLTHSSWHTLLTGNSFETKTDRLEAMGTYTDNKINRLARGGKQRGHIAGVGRYCRHEPQTAQFKSGGARGSGGCGDEEEGADPQDDEDEDGDGDT
nr:hypothetical protein [Tanacetum cinerariifolium]